MPAGAATAAGTEDAIARVQEQMAGTAARVHELTLEYDQSWLQASSLAEQAAADRREVATLHAQVAEDRSALRRAVLLSYTGAMATQHMPRSANPAVGEEYLQVAAGDMGNVIDQYRLSERKLTASETALESDQRAAAQAASDAASAEQEALAEAASEQVRLGELQAQLSSLAAAAGHAESAAGVPVDNGLVSVVKALVSPPAPASGGAGGVWLRLRECESGDNYRANTGNGYYGAYQFSQQTWSSLDYPGRPDLEPPAMQDQAAMRLQKRSGWGQWPACSAALGLT